MLNILIFLGLALTMTIGFRMLFLNAWLKKLFGLALLSHCVNMMILLSGTTPPQEKLLGAVSFVQDGGRFSEMVDPLPQALVLTAIVISFGVTAFLVVFYLLSERDRKA